MSQATREEEDEDTSAIRTSRHNNNHTMDEERQQQPQVDKDEWLLSCRCDSAYTIYNLLSCLASVASSSSSSSTSQRTTAPILSSSQSRRRRKTASSSSSNSATLSLQPVTVFCSPTGLTFHVTGKAKQMQASVDVPAALFTDYNVTSSPRASQHQDRVDSDDNDDDTDNDHDWQAGGEFCLNLTTLLECLSVLGLEGHGSTTTTTTSGSSNFGYYHGSNKATTATTQLACSYNLTQEIFKLELLQQDILCTAAIPGMQIPNDFFFVGNHNTNNNSNSLALAFRSSPAVARLIYQSESLRQVISELDHVSGAAVATLSLGKDGLKIAVVGAWGECLVSVPAKGSHVVSVDVVDGNGDDEALSSSHTYHLHALLASFKGLDIAQETCLTMNEAGMMAIQHQVVVDGDIPAFVDHILCCLEEEDSEDEDEDDEGVVLTSRTRESLSVSQASSAEDRQTSTATSRLSFGEQDDQESRRVSSSPGGLALARTGRHSLLSSTQSSSPGMTSKVQSRGHPAAVVASTTQSSSPPVHRRRPQQGSWWGKANDSDESESDSNAGNDDGEDDDERYRPRQQSSLIGQVKTQSTAASSSLNRSHHARSARPRSHPAAAQQQQYSDDEQDDNNDEKSHNLLEGGSYHEGKDDDHSFQDDFEAPLSPPRRRRKQRNDSDSSPELYYGKKEMQR